MKTPNSVIWPENNDFKFATYSVGYGFFPENINVVFTEQVSGVDFEKINFIQFLE